MQLTDAYSTDGELQRYRLALLRDDKRYFPEYRAVPFVQVQMDQRIKAVLDSLNGRLTDERMRALNASVVVAGQTFQSIATSPAACSER